MKFFKTFLILLFFSKPLFSFDFKKAEKITKGIFIASFLTSLYLDYKSEITYMKYTATHSSSEAEKLRKETQKYENMKKISITICISSGTISLLLDILKGNEKK